MKSHMSVPEGVPGPCTLPCPSAHILDKLEAQGLADRLVGSPSYQRGPTSGPIAADLAHPAAPDSCFSTSFTSPLPEFSIPLSQYASADLAARPTLFEHRRNYGVDDA